MAVTWTETEANTRFPGSPPASKIRSIWATARAFCDRYAPEAPEDVSNEAALRFGSYLYQTRTLPPFPVSVGSLDIQPIATSAAFRYSGAQSLLSPWKVRRGGTVG